MLLKSNPPRPAATSGTASGEVDSTEGMTEGAAADEDGHSHGEGAEDVSSKQCEGHGGRGGESAQEREDDVRLPWREKPTYLAERREL